MRDARLVDRRIHDMSENLIHFGFDTLGIYRDIDDVQFSLIYTKLSQYTSNTNSWTVPCPDFGDFAFLTFDNTFHRWQQEQYLNISLTTEQYHAPIIQFIWSLDYTKIYLYWKFFRSCRISDIDDPFLQAKKILSLHLNLYEWFTNWKYRKFFRADYCFDIKNMSVNEYYNFIDKKHKKIKNYQEWNEIETSYIWSRNSKYSFTRVYNKLQETSRKVNDNLYADYFQNNIVTRIEFQFMSDFFNSKMDFDNIELLFSKIKYYTWIDTEYSLSMRWWKRYNKDYILDPTVYSKKLVSMMTKAINNGINIKDIFKEINKTQNLYYLKVKGRSRIR